LTSKKYYIYSEKFNKKLIEENNFIGAFWHNRLSMMFFLRHKKIKDNVLISEHKDGRVIASTSSLFGVNIITGSSSNISMESLKNIIRCLTKGENLTITPDGPRGPVYQINSNIAKIAQKTSKMIIPISFSCKKKIILRSWDRFIFPLPFNTIYFVYGNPIYPDNADIKTALKNELDRIYKEFDKKFE
jgi:lysophospholipid acyltransferase (LPLAT)-like uncharacterized protein